MATPHVDLDAVDVDDTPSLTFSLHGETYTCRNRDSLPAWFDDAIIRGDEPISLNAFFDNVLVPEDAERFRPILESRDHTLVNGKFRPLMDKIATVIFERPTSPPKRSGPGRRNIPATSKADSSSPGTPRRRSAS